MKKTLIYRLRCHKKNFEYSWDSFSWFGLLSVKKDNTLRGDFDTRQIGTEQVLDHLEAILLETIDPILNKQGGRFGNAEEYLQAKDERVVADNQKLDKIYNWVLDQQKK